MILLTTARIRKMGQPFLLAEQITAVAAPLPLEKETITRQATRSSEMLLMKIPVAPFREKTLIRTQNLTPIVHKSLGGRQLSHAAVPHYLVLFRPPDKQQVVAEQLS